MRVCARRCVHICVHICILACACVLKCVCVCEREREREREIQMTCVVNLIVVRKRNVGTTSLSLPEHCLFVSNRDDMHDFTCNFPAVVIYFVSSVCSSRTTTRFRLAFGVINSG